MTEPPPLRRCLLWWGFLILDVITLSTALVGQAFLRYETSVQQPTDWSHHHLIFSQPATSEQVKRVQQDARYWQQLFRRSPELWPVAKTVKAIGPTLHLGGKSSFRNKSPKLRRDWAENMGSGASIGAGNFPAKFSFAITQAYCVNRAQPDFVVYSTGLFGTAAQASIVAYDNLYSGCSNLHLGTAANFAVLATATVTSAGDTVVTGANIGIFPGTSLTGFPPGVLTNPAVQHLGDAVASQAEADANTAFGYCQGLTGAAGITSPLDGQTLTPGLYKAGSSLALGAGATVTLDGNGTYIFQIGSTLDLAGTVVLSGGATAGNVIWLVGSSATLEGTTLAAGNIIAQASITLDAGASLAGRAIALAGAVTMVGNAVTTVDTVPSVYWAYNTAGDKILTSPSLSLDGTQVLFVQTDGEQGSLVLLKWAASTTETTGNPTSLARVTRALYPTCTAPCMTTELLREAGGTVDDDTNSSPFYDYSNDTAYVGDNSGWLHKFTPVLNGVLTEVRTRGWPVQVNPRTPTALSEPIHDSASGNVFVEDVGGFLYLVNSTTATVTTSGRLDFSGFAQGPIVDSTAGLVYVFASSDGTESCSGGAACTAVYELGTTFANGAVGSKVVVGASTLSGTPPNPLYIGDFDSTYQNSVNATGNLYVCGNSGGAPTLYQVAIQGGLLGTANAGPVLSISNTPCSPVTDSLNPNAEGGPTEWIFVSTQADAVSSGCDAGGCVMNFKNTPWLVSTAYSIGQEVVDSNFNIQVVDRAGVSSRSVPLWSTTLGGAINDGTVQWLDQGPFSAVTPAGWIKGNDYSKDTLILDSNGNIQWAKIEGKSGGSIPEWSTTAGVTTADNTVIWENLGGMATSALAAAGGTSGIVIDNTVGSGTLLGTSQVYFSTLSNQTCGTSGTGGCAVQASQSALK